MWSFFLCAQDYSSFRILKSIKGPWGPGPSSLRTSPPIPEDSPHLFLGWRDVFTGLQTHGPPCFLTKVPQTYFVQLQNNFLSVHQSFFPTNLHLSQSHLQAPYRAVQDLLLRGGGGVIAPLLASERKRLSNPVFQGPKLFCEGAEVRDGIHPVSYGLPSGGFLLGS